MTEKSNWKIRAIMLIISIFSVGIPLLLAGILVIIDEKKFGGFMIVLVYFGYIPYLAIMISTIISVLLGNFKKISHLLIWFFGINIILILFVLFYPIFIKFF